MATPTQYQPETQSPLLANATFTGAWRRVPDEHCAFFNAVITTDQAGSAYIQGSPDGKTNINATTASTSITAGTPATVACVISTTYFRIVLVNGGVNQTTLNIDTAFTPAPLASSSAGGGGGPATQSGTWTVGINANTANLAAETGGNLATIATAQGAQGTGLNPPTGGSGVLGFLSGIYNKLSGSLAVTGTFWQATQPVSIASMPSTPVTGTFWPATQPVSVVDGGDVTQGAKADAAATSSSGTYSVVALLKYISSLLAGTITTKSSAGLGVFQAVAAGSTNGTVIGSTVAGSVGVELWLPSSSSLTFYFATAGSSPSSPPTYTFTISGSMGPNPYIALNGVDMYIVGTNVGTPLFRRV